MNIVKSLSDIYRKSSKIASLRGRGQFVIIINTIKSYQSSITTDENIISQIRHDLINESMEVFIENMKAINVRKEELIEIINDKY